MCNYFLYTILFVHSGPSKDCKNISNICHHLFCSHVYKFLNCANILIDIFVSCRILIRAQIWLAKRVQDVEFFCYQCRFYWWFCMKIPEDNNENGSKQFSGDNFIQHSKFLSQTACYIDAGPYITFIFVVSLLHWFAFVWMACFLMHAEFPILLQDLPSLRVEACKYFAGCWLFVCINLYLLKVFLSASNWFFLLTEHKVIIVGLDNAGKTTILYQLWVLIINRTFHSVFNLEFSQLLNSTSCLIANHNLLVSLKIIGRYTNDL